MDSWARVLLRTAAVSTAAVLLGTACDTSSVDSPGGVAGRAMMSAGNTGVSGASGAGGNGAARGGAPSGGASMAGGASSAARGGGGAAGVVGGTAGRGGASGGAVMSGAGGRGASSGGMAGGGGSTGGVTNGGAPGAAGSSAGAAPTKNPVVYIGGSSNGASYPFTIYDFEVARGALTARTPTVDLGPNPSYIALAPSKKYLVVTNERDDDTGGLTSASIGANGALTKLKHVTGTDGGFTHVAIHPGGEFVFGASYNGGSVSVFPVASDGTLGAQAGNVDFGAQAQTHCVAFDADGAHVFVPNKGNDEVAQLLFGSGTLTANTPPRVSAKSGAGPRHIALHPNGKFAFVINELDSTMTPYALANGLLTAGTSVSTLPAGFSGQNTGAHVEISPDGRFLYGSNRGHDSIVVYSVDQTTGALTLLQHMPSGGSTPRDFDMDPFGRFIVVANQGDSKVAAFAIGPDGKLTPLGNPIGSAQGCAAVQIAYFE